MTEKRDESRDVFLDTEQVDALGVGFGEVWCIRGYEHHAGLTQYVPASELESVTRERDAAVRRVTALERALADLLDTPASDADRENNECTARELLEGKPHA